MSTGRPESWRVTLSQAIRRADGSITGFLPDGRPLVIVPTSPERRCEPLKTPDAPGGPVSPESAPDRPQTAESTGSDPMADPPRAVGLEIRVLKQAGEPYRPVRYSEAHAARLAQEEALRSAGYLSPGFLSPGFLSPVDPVTIPVRFGEHTGPPTPVVHLADGSRVPLSTYRGFVAATEDGIVPLETVSLMNPAVREGIMATENKIPELRHDPRPDWDTWALGIAEAVSKRADCTRRQVGAVILDRSHRVIATGYNGYPAGSPGCASSGACPRGRQTYEQIPKDSPYVGTDSPCGAVHAEENAVLHAHESLRGATLYSTHQPCPNCARFLAGTGIARAVWPEGESIIRPA